MTAISPDGELTWQLPEVDAERMKVLALLLADPNPIHFDAEAAAGIGAARVVNQGPSTMATVYNLFEQTHPDHRVARVSFRLLGNVLAGDAVTVSAVPAGEAGSGREAFDVVVRTGEGATVITARAELVRRREVAS
ncbi:hypothetical protein GEV29_01065 [Aeromicrobium sp. SMF47]|uniref:MaoC family dehydratase n=1 Tax=Aeromicrobium TaxID=2040 RepID=UPI00129E9A84|nr:MULTISPECIES: MaoC family dehydratase [Aeromicrobium]MRJ75118.1 hypothetical protein [Aeromicrobium yanjiei]MRK02825.1 hypothetical protein [Aeromicrobium sp. S22]